MLNRRLLVVIMLIFTCSLRVEGQERRAEISLDFRVNSTRIDRSFSNNAANLDEITDFLREVQDNPAVSITSIWFCGTASPEGSSQVNRRLARGRMQALEEVVRSMVEIPDSLVRRDDSYIPWLTLADMVEKSDMPQRDTVLRIVRGDSEYVPYLGQNTVDSRVVALQRLDGGRVWKVLLRDYFSRMRNASLVVVSVRYRQPMMGSMLSADVSFPMSDVDESSMAPVYTYQPPQPEPEPEWTRRIYLKTNVPAWGMLIANVAFEIDIVPRLSFALPLYYSGIDHFASHTKFRTFTVQPEFRIWPKRDNQGFFVGLHGGMGYYNYATHGNMRIQDHDGDTPAWGGGLSVGYRLSFKRNPRWGMEFSVGAGVYDVHYDKYYNEPNGLLTRDYRDTFIGIDNAAISVTYKFDLKSRKNRR